MSARFLFEAPGVLEGSWKHAVLSAVAGHKTDCVVHHRMWEPTADALRPLVEARSELARSGDHGDSSLADSILVSQWPLALWRPPEGAITAALLGPPAQLAHYALSRRDMPSWQAMLDAGLQFESYRLLFSPGFDLQRLLTDSAFNLPTPPLNYSDGCTVEEALARLDSFKLVLFSQGEQALEIMQVLMHFEQLPPNPDSLPAGSHPADDSWPEDAQSLVSDFDRRFFRAAWARYAVQPHLIRSRYESYHADYPTVHGVELGPHEGLNLSLSPYIGPGWHPAERAANNRWFRWSAGFGAEVHVPLRRPGRYQVRAYVFAHGTPNLEAQLHGLGNISEMFALDHGSVRVLEGQITLHQSAWCLLKFQHGDLPIREGTDDRQRGFVLGELLVRRLS